MVVLSRIVMKMLALIRMVGALIVVIDKVVVMIVVVVIFTIAFFCICRQI